MANRIPLIVDTLDSNKLKELPVGDNLDLGGAGITNAGTVNATDIRINNVSFNNPFSGDYNDLTNKPLIPTLPTALSQLANDIGYLTPGTTTTSITEGNNLYHTTARVDARVNAQTGASLDLSQKLISDIKDIAAVTAGDDGKVLYYDHPSTSWKWKTDAGGVTKLPQLNDVDAVTETDNNKILYYDHATTSFKWKIDTSSFTFSIGADDSTLRTINSNESIKFNGGTGISTTSDAEGNLTFTIGNLTALQDVSTSGATNGQALVYDSGAGTWGPGNVASGISSVNDLGDVDTVTTTPVNDYVLSWKTATSKWEPRVLNNVNAATVTAAPDVSNVNQFVTFVAASDSNGQALSTQTNITYNPSTTVLSAPTVAATTLQATNFNITGAIANGVNEVTFACDLKIATSNEVRFYDTDNTNYSGFRAPTNLTSNVTFSLPDGDGTNGQVITTDGSGILSWASVIAGEVNEFSFKTIVVSGQTNVVADTKTDTLTFVEGSNMTITTSGDSITFASSGGGGSGTPGGSDTHVQFNDSSSFGGDAGLVYNKTTDTLTGVNIKATGTIEADIIKTSGTGVPTFTSASNIIFDAANAVVVQKAPLRLGSFDTNGIAGLVGQAGDVIYNSSEQQLVFWNGTIWATTNDSFSFSVGADDSTLRTITKDEGIKFIGGSGIDTTSDAEGNITITSGGPIITYTVTANGSSSYRFAGPGIDGTTDNPNFSLYKGFTYVFINSAGAGHPLAIRVSNGGSDFTEGVTGSQTGTQTFIPQHDTSDSALVYQCTNHAGMVGNLTIV